MLLGSVNLATSDTDGPLPPSFHPPSNWLAAVAPPHKNPLGNWFIQKYLHVFYYNERFTRLNLFS